MNLLQSVLVSNVSSGRSFGAYQRWIHWSLPRLCIAQLPTSWAIQCTHLAHGIAKPDPFDLFLHQVHAWMGRLTETESYRECCLAEGLRCGVPLNRRSRELTFP